MEISQKLDSINQQLDEVSHLIEINSQLYHDYLTSASKFTTYNITQIELLLHTSLSQCTEKINQTGQKLLSLAQECEQLSAPSTTTINKSSISYACELSHKLLLIEDHLHLVATDHNALLEQILFITPLIFIPHTSSSSNKPVAIHNPISVSTTTSPLHLLSSPLLHSLQLSIPIPSSYSPTDKKTFADPRHGNSQRSAQTEQPNTSSNTKTLSKRVYVSSAIQQQIVDSLQRSKQQLGQNIQQTEQSFDTLVISNELLLAINRDSTTAQTSASYSASLTQQHERKALFERNLVRWSFIAFIVVAIWIMSRRLLWFLTPAIYLSKPVFGTLRLAKTIIFFFITIVGDVFSLFPSLFSSSTDSFASQLHDHINNILPDDLHNDL